MDGEVMLRDHCCSDDLSTVKSISDKLELETKRKSVLQWKVLIDQRQKEGYYKSNNQRNDSKGSGEDIVSVKNVVEELADRSEETIASGSDSVASANDSMQVVHCNSVGRLPSVSEETLLKSNETDGEDDDQHEPCTSEATTSSKAENILDAKKSEHLEKETKKNTPTERKNTPTEKIFEALANLRKDLILMHLEDHAIARKLLDIRRDMVIEKAKISCDQHAEMLDDFTYELEEEDFLGKKLKVSDVSSVLMRRPGSLLSRSSPLRPLGINKISMSFKRYSVI